jgi:hypothetical protein
MDSLEQGKKLPDTFWKNFPTREMLRNPSTRVDIKALEALINKHKHDWSAEEKLKAELAVKSLKEGAPAHQKTDLPAAKMHNAPSAYEHAAKLTEAVKNWVAGGVVAGPFKTPPLPGFRANCIMAVARKEKIRPVVNLSSPKGASFNDNINKLAVMKVRMSAAAQFGQSVRAAGPGARITKLDMKDAYKLVPAKTSDYRLQGFEWLGRLFIDTQQIFGSAAAAANFDKLASTVLRIVLSELRARRISIHRTLDDVVSIVPASSSKSAEFAATYRRIADRLNIELAADCPKHDKAFTDETWGTVLGIVFDTLIQCWRMPEHKVKQLLLDTGNFVTAGWVSLEETQKVAGRINHLAQMLPFLRAFRRPLNDLLGEFNEDEEILLPVSPQLAADLSLCANVAVTAMDWLPITEEHERPPEGAWHFVSDAAGGLGHDKWAGVASLGLTSTQKGI